MRENMSAISAGGRDKYYVALQLYTADKFRHLR